MRDKCKTFPDKNCRWSPRGSWWVALACCPGNHHHHHHHNHHHHHHLNHYNQWSQVHKDGRGSGQYCGATLISDTHVLTAAHCIKPWVNILYHFHRYNYMIIMIFNNIHRYHTRPHQCEFIVSNQIQQGKLIMMSMKVIKLAVWSQD